jgi:hypothetical protein
MPAMDSVKISFVSGDCIAVDLSNAKHIADARNLIACAVGKPVRCIMLVNGGRHLDDESLMSSINLHDPLYVVIDPVSLELEKKKRAIVNALRGVREMDLKLQEMKGAVTHAVRFNPADRSCYTNLRSNGNKYQINNLEYILQTEPLSAEDEKVVFAQIQKLKRDAARDSFKLNKRRARFMWPSIGGVARRPHYGDVVPMEIAVMEEKIKQKVNSLDIPGHLEAFCEELADLRFGTEQRGSERKEDGIAHSDTDGNSDSDSDGVDVRETTEQTFGRHVRTRFQYPRPRFRPIDTERIRKKFDFLFELKDVVNEELDSLRNTCYPCNCCGCAWDALLGEHYGCDSVMIYFEHGDLRLGDNSIVEHFNHSNSDGSVEHEYVSGSDHDEVRCMKRQRRQGCAFDRHTKYRK